MLRALSPSWADGDAPSPEELPPWRPKESPETVESESREICWTPSFKSLVGWPSHTQVEVNLQQEVTEVAETADTKPRISMAPTVHDAVCEDLDSEDEENEEIEVIEDRYDEAEDAAQVQKSQASQTSQTSQTSQASQACQASAGDSTEVNEAALRELVELRAALQKERAQKEDLEKQLLQMQQQIQQKDQQTAEKLNSCEAQMTQMEQELKKSRAERDALRRRLQETAEQHVELTKRLRRSASTEVLKDFERLQDFKKRLPENCLEKCGMHQDDQFNRPLLYCGYILALFSETSCFDSCAFCR